MSQHPLSSNYALPPGLVMWPDSVVLVNFYASMSSTLVALFLFSRFVLEPLAPRVYGDIFARMNIKDQRSFICHHSWLVIKTLCLAGAWPLVNILFRHKGIFQPVVSEGSITNGDVLSVLFSMIIASFCYELLYRLQISPVSALHHIAGICLASWQLSTELSTVPWTEDVQIQSDQESFGQSSQFKIIMIYGAFEVAFESWMHVCCILYRVHKGKPALCAAIWGLGGAYVLCGSLLELAVMIVVWKKFWHGWSLEYKIAMPIIHLCFMAAQLHGARIGLQLRQRFLREALEQKERSKAIHIELDAQSLDSTTKLPALKISAEPVTPISPALNAFRRSSVVQPSPSSATLSKRIVPWR